MNHIGLPPSGLYIWTTLVFRLLVNIYEPHPSSTFWFIWIKVSKFIQMTVYTHAPGLDPNTPPRFCFIVNVTQYEIWFKLQTTYREYIILFMLKHISVWITSHQLVDMEVIYWSKHSKTHSLQVQNLLRSVAISLGLCGSQRYSNDEQWTPLNKK